MEQVDRCLEQLVSSVLESDIYKEYQRVQEKIKLEPEKEKAIQDFRRRNFVLQRNKDNVYVFDEIDRLEQEFSQFRQDSLVEEYLNAEVALCRLVQKINLTLMAKIDFDLGFFNE